MEPTRNARVVRSQRRVFYNFTRRYGEQATVNKVDTSATDYDTGNRTRTYTTVTIRNVVYVPSVTARNVTFTPAMMQAVRQYAWQGGAGTDIETVSFLIADQDLRKSTWGEIEATQFIGWRGDNYEVVSSNQFDGGVVVNCKTAKGSRP
jgi:hypothetical protein